MGIKIVEEKGMTFEEVSKLEISNEAKNVLVEAVVTLRNDRNQYGFIV